MGDSFKFIEEYRIGKDFHAFLIKAPESFVLGLTSSPLIKYSEPNGIITIDDYDNMACSSSNSRSWGLARVSSRSTTTGPYKYELTGSGVTSYIVDTGINTAHTDFGGRARWGATFTGDGNNADCNGHGTHVAGTVGGKEFGIAKATSLVAVKVLNCAGSGSYSGIVSGMQWVAQQHKNKKGPSVANMSLGGSKSSLIDDAVKSLVQTGVTTVVAAGNSNLDACTQSPSSSPHAITVGSTTNSDVRSSFSNFGKCVDIFAPGSDITSPWIGGTSVIRTISGTSMASPHVAGVAAQLLGQNSRLSPSEVKSKILSLSSASKINLNCGGSSVCNQSPNRLLYSGC